MVQVDTQQFHLFCSWHHHFRRRLNLRNPLYVVAHDEDTVARLRRGWPDVSILSPPSMIQGARNDTRSSNFGGASFYALNTAKIKAAQELLESSSRPVVFTDIDTAWLKSPLEYLARALPPSKIFAIAPDADEVLPGATGRFHVCACFFAACPSNATRNVLRQWWRASGSEGGHSNEQKVFQRLLDERPGLVFGAEGGRVAGPLQQNHSSQRKPIGAYTGGSGPVAILSHAAFPTGRHDPQITPEAVWLHANWIQRKTRQSTTTAKVNRLIKHGLWHRCAE
jgi:hypothetical protein